MARAPTLVLLRAGSGGVAHAAFRAQFGYVVISFLGELLGVPVGNADYMTGGYETLTTSTAAPRQQQTRAP